MARAFQAFRSEGPPTFKLQDEDALAAYAYCENVVTGVEELPQLGHERKSAKSSSSQSCQNYNHKVGINHEYDTRRSRGTGHGRKNQRAKCTGAASGGHARGDRAAAPLPRVDRITYDELASDLRLHYETTGTRGLKEADTRFKALKPFFIEVGP